MATRSRSSVSTRSRAPCPLRKGSASALRRVTWQSKAIKVMACDLSKLAVMDEACLLYTSPSPRD
eukprot:1753545-Alexandrium_andersonii.AAC.1